VEERGAVFTRREVVNFILDLAGYSAPRPLLELRLLEPSFGDGDFLFPAIDRLLAERDKVKGEREPLPTLRDCIRAVELHRATFERTRAAVVARLEAAGVDAGEAEAITGCWLLHGDFLLIELPGRFDVVVGNPPYVRQEMIPDVLLDEYRSRYATIYDRADLYVPFIERSLHALQPGGARGFICADRWMKNRYGGPLRELVAKNFHLKVHVDMTGVEAFHSDVTAYPAITVITRDKRATTCVARRPAVNAAALKALAGRLLAERVPQDAEDVEEIPSLATGAEPWDLESSRQLALVRRLELGLPLLEQAGCKVGIGVATGADKAFIGRFDALDVEDDRKQPLVMTRDIADGTVCWRGLGVIDPFAEDGSLVDLEQFPRLKRYLLARRDVISARHCARKTPANWYRTIDRITPALPSPQPVLRHLAGMGSPSAAGGAVVGCRPPVCSRILDSHARRLSALSGSVPASHSHPAMGGRSPFAAQGIGRRGRRARHPGL
jgi:hypothetical protein